MQQLFATALEIECEDPEQIRASVLFDVAAWAWRGEGDPPDLIGLPSGDRGGEGEYSLSWHTLAADGHPAVLTRVLLGHRDQDHAGIEWITAVDVVRAESSVRLTVQIHRRASQMQIVPAPVDLHRPRIVPSVIQRHPCTAGDGIRMSVVERVLQPADIEDFVRSVLTFPGRRLPVVVLATPSVREQRAVSARSLADELAGLAHVYVLSGQLSWERLRDMLGQGRLVPRGGARLYWPGLASPTDTIRHPYWGRAAVCKRPGRPPFRRRLFSMLSQLSVLRVPPDPAIPGIRVAHAAQRREELKQRSAEEAVGAALEELERVEDLQNQLDDLRRELEEKNEIILRHEENWRQLQGAVDSTQRPDDTDASRATATTVETWEEAAELAELLVDSDAFFITERGMIQLADCDYPNPARMFDQLNLLAEAAEAYHKADAEIGGRFDEWVRTRFGIEIALHDGGLEEAGRDTFEFDGNTYSRQPHVKVDDYKDPSNCGRIYFALDGEAKRIIVDHIGLHL